MCPVLPTRVGVRQARKIVSFKNALKSSSSSHFNQNKQISSCTNQYRHNNGSSNDGGAQETNFRLAFKVIAAAGFTSIVTKNSLSNKDVLAEEKDDVDVEQEIVKQENR